MKAGYLFTRFMQKYVYREREKGVFESACFSFYQIFAFVLSLFFSNCTQIAWPTLVISTDTFGFPNGVVLISLIATFVVQN